MSSITASHNKEFLDRTIFYCSYNLIRKGKYLSPQARAFVDLVKPSLFTRRDWFEAGHSER